MLTASTPQAPVDGGGGSGGAGQSLALSAGGGGADSGARTQARLTSEDYDGFRQNANEQARQYAVMAALAPVRYPYVVGVIAFGVLNPDPAYAPTFQTAPEDRASVLERAGEIGLATAVGAVAIGISVISKEPPGIIYLRKNVVTAEEYVGQVRLGRFDARQVEHAANHPGEKFEYHILEEIPSGSGRNLDVAEEDWIRAGGGPKRFGGPLANERYQMSDKSYKASGGIIPKPTL